MGDQSEEPYSLYIESYPAVQEGLTTYRIYVNMEDATDRMSAVYGNGQNPFVICSGGVQQLRLMEVQSLPGFLVFPKQLMIPSPPLVWTWSFEQRISCEDQSLVQDAHSQSIFLRRCNVYGVQYPNQWRDDLTCGNGLPDEI